MTLRSTTLVLALAVFLAGCGGSDATVDSPTTTEAKASTTAEGARPSTTTAAAPTTEATTPPATEPPSGGDAGTGTATIGDVTWEFALDDDPRGTCQPDAGGTFFVVMFTKDENGADVAFNVQAQPTGRVIVQVGNPLISEGMWITDEAIYDSFPDLEAGVTAEASINGNTITGSGTFYEDRSLRETLQTGGPYTTGLRQGTFSATCPAG